MIDDFFAWLPGNDVIDWAAIVGTAFCVGLPVAFGLWALRDKLRHGSGDHHRPVGEVAPAVSEPAVKPGSPFAPKQREAK